MSLVMWGVAVVTAFALGFGASRAQAAQSAARPGSAALNQRIDALERKVRLLEDRAAIEKLTRAYGYYIDKKLWDEVIPLFAPDAEVEISNRGVYRNTNGVDRLFRQVIGHGRVGLAAGELSNHMVLQGIVDVAPDGRTANGRWRAFIQIGMWQKAALWAEGTYDIRYVRREGIWQFQRMRWYGTYFAPYDQGWAKQTFSNNAPSTEYPPDAPPSSPYDAYPGHYVPPFPYPNPVSQRPWSLEDTLRYSTTGMDPGTAANAGAANSPLSNGPAPTQPPASAPR
jgi:hypothetical protein